MSEQVSERVIAAIAESQKVPAEKIGLDSTFEELGFDSLDAVNILFALENEFNINIPDEAAQEVRSIRGIVESVEKLLAGDGATAGA